MSSIASLFLVFFFVEVTLCTRWSFEIQVYTYDNPFSANMFGSCCDSDGVLDNTCNNPCDNMFVFCVRPSRLSSGCQYGLYRTGTISGGDDLMFNSTIGSHRNPLTFNGTQWPANNALFLLIQVNDDDGLPRGLNPLIGSIERTLSLPVVGNGVTNLTLTSSFSIMRVGVKIKCQEYYYGSQCQVYCEPRDDSTGHFICDSQGNKVCTEGYQFNTTNCTTPICNNPACNANQDCIYPNTCVCKDGWAGENCNECIVNCSTTMTVMTPTSSMIIIKTSTRNSLSSVISVSSSFVYASPSMTTTTTSTSVSSMIVLIQPSPNSNNSSNAHTSNTSTTNIVIGVVVGLLAMLVIAVLVIITLFVLHKRRNSLGKKKGQEDTDTLDNPNYYTMGGPSTSENYSSDYYLVSHNYGFERTLQNPLYDEPATRTTTATNNNDNDNLYSLADDVDKSIPLSYDDTQNYCEYNLPEDYESSYSTITNDIYRTKEESRPYSVPKKEYSQIFDEGHYEFGPNFKTN